MPTQPCNLVSAPLPLFPYADPCAGITPTLRWFMGHSTTVNGNAMHQVEEALWIAKKN